MVGRVFSKRLYEALAGLKNHCHCVRISSDLRVDLTPFCDASAISLFTGASCSFGYSVFWNGHWSASTWPPS